jgi:hypothetical protein
VSDMVKGILAGGAGLVLVLVAIFFGLGYLISDEKGLPVPTTVAGSTCWLTTKGIDVLDCRKRRAGPGLLRALEGALVGREQVSNTRSDWRASLPLPVSASHRPQGQLPESHRRLRTRLASLTRTRVAS